jgi:hypothetical protein
MGSKKFTVKALFIMYNKKTKKGKIKDGVSVMQHVSQRNIIYYGMLQIQS